MGKDTTSSGPSTALATAQNHRPRSGSDATGGSLTPIATRHDTAQFDGASDAEASGGGPDVMHEASNLHDSSDNDDDDGDDETEEVDSDEEEDEEPWFKSYSVSKDIKSIYRNGDAASCLVTSGDKMVIGTHNGCIHVISATTFEVIRSYRAHRATVTSISISPFPHATMVSTSPAKHALETLDEGLPSSETASMFSTRSVRPAAGSRMAVRQSTTPSGTIYIASSSVEGNVCVASLSDAKDVMLRNFGRPVHAVALSPSYSKDRTFLSGGTSGSLILTVGGRIGGKSDATILGTGIANSSGWLNSLGLTSNRGKDSILHDGEGTINTINWSQSGKYVMWVNEEGIKVMRSNFALGAQAAELAWKRLSHIDRPKLPEWDDMASLWKARAEWVDRDCMEAYDGTSTPSSGTADSKKTSQGVESSYQAEKLIVGWGGTIWVIDVVPTVTDSAEDLATKKRESITVTTILRTDCIISGISLYTPNVLLVLAYVENEDGQADAEHKEDKHAPEEHCLRRTFRHKHNGLQPEIRLIDLETKKQVAADPQDVSRFQTLTSSDYHLGIIPPPRPATASRPRSTLDTLWDATVVQPTRLISSAASIRTTFSGSQSMFGRQNSFAPTVTSVAESNASHKDAIHTTTSEGSKIIVLTPFDCLFAVKRGWKDRLAWLEEREQYEEAWNLIDQHPEAFQTTADSDDSSTVKSLSTHGNLSSTDLGLDDTLSSVGSSHLSNSVVLKEKARIGQLWLRQLVDAADWQAAGRICGKVLQTKPQWERWVTKFTENDKYDEITPYIPANLESPLPSTIYESILDHYISVDRFKARELLEQWPTVLFDLTGVIDAIETHLPLIDPNTEEWRITVGSLAQLYLASGRYREALRCYIELKDTETTMALISQYHLLEAIGEDIPSILFLHVPQARIAEYSTTELEAATTEVIQLLVSGASSGIVRPETVIAQLRYPSYRVFLYFYIKALWTPAQEVEKPRGRFHHHREGDRAHIMGPSEAAGKLRADEGRAVVDEFADVVVDIFADFDRSLLMDFLQSSTAYSYDVATTICEKKHYTRELIFLLSKTGETKRALSLILSDLNDVSAAIAFAKQQGDPDLWEDLLSYSMDKPDCIRGLLKEAGTIINPIDLVKRIPSGLEIEGLRDGLTHLIREHDIQASISEGVARVLVGEVATRMELLRQARRRGIKFNIAKPKPKPTLQRSTTDSKPTTTKALKRVQTFVAAAATPAQEEAPATLEEDANKLPSRCAGCDAILVEGQEQETLVAFGCGHIFHLSHVKPPIAPASMPTEQNADENMRAADTAKVVGRQPSQKEAPPTMFDERALSFHGAIGPKVTNARLLQDTIRPGCRVCLLHQQSAGP